MNKFQYILLGLTAVAGVSCADLDYNEASSRDEEWTYNSPINGVKNLVYDVYAQMPSEFKDDLYGQGAMIASASDEAEFALSYSSIHNYYNGGWTASNPFSNTWTVSYRAIAQVHMYLERIDKIDLSEYEYAPDYENMVQQFEIFPYELRFLRAYYYFELVRAYGDVPLVTTTLTNAQANTVERAAAADVFKFIVDECDAVAQYLPVSYNDIPGQEIGRATRGAALALKARALLYQASPLFNKDNDKELWKQAAAASKFIIDNASIWGYSLSPYANLWGHDTFTNPEFIFVLGTTADNTFEKNNYPVGVENGNSGNCPTQSLVDMYEYQADGKTFKEKHPGTVNVTTENPYDGLDPRFELTVVKNGDLWPSNTNQQLVMETFQGGFNGAPKYGATPTGYYLKKFVDGSCITTTNNPTTTRHNWIVMRLAEVYLNYAEAMYNYYGDADNAGEFGMSANQAINVLRNRADIMMPEFSGSADFEQRYMRERMVELAFEGHRFWDVRRWKKGAEFFSNVDVADLTKDASGNLILNRATKARKWDDKYYLYPIPQSERQKNGNLTQNTGW
ncbi:MAG: RagB/SusD family nutrient uptake outer membrane protein [Bacteroidales bacterium]|nr:RagB/SusD family nutrient uptake outer membrane protein [Bacteroidales bacterium]